MSATPNEPVLKKKVKRVVSSGRRSLQYSHGDEGFWDKLNKLQKKYLPALSSLIENIETVIKENGTTRQILEIRAKLGQLNSMLLNIYGIHKFNKRMEILESLETQVSRWIAAWELCAKDIDLPCPTKLPDISRVKKLKTKSLVREIPDKKEEFVAKEATSVEPPQKTGKDSSEGEIDEESEDTSTSEEESTSSEEESESEESSSDSDDSPTQIPSLGFNELNDLVSKFQKFDPLGNTEKRVMPPKKRNRGLGKTHSGFRSK